MTIAEWLNKAEQQLTHAGVTTARLDAVVLLEDTLQRDRSWLLAHDDEKISPAQRALLKKLLNRRAQHEPLAYVRGRTEFYGRTFVITPAVLEPRPESETMIELLKLLVQDGPLPAPATDKIHIGDVGTGSGALGITAALELPNSRVELLDIDENALKTAEMNVDLFTLNIPTLHSDLLNGSQQKNDVLLCNLPYVPDHYQINLAASHEPKLAIFGGEDGLDVYRKLFRQLHDSDHKPLYILCEALPPQHESLTKVAAEDGYELQQIEDFIQLFQLKK